MADGLHTDRNLDVIGEENVKRVTKAADTCVAKLTWQIVRDLVSSPEAVAAAHRKSALPKAAN